MANFLNDFFENWNKKHNVKPSKPDFRINDPRFADTKQSQGFTGVKKDQINYVVNKSKKAQQQIDKDLSWYNDSKRNYVYNNDGSYKDTQAILDRAKKDYVKGILSSTPQTLAQQKAYIDELTNANKYAQYQRRQDYLKQNPTAQNIVNEYAMRDAYDDSFGERLAKTTGKVALDIANTPIQTFDLAKGYFDRDFNPLDPNNFAQRNRMDSANLSQQIYENTSDLEKGGLMFAESNLNFLGNLALSSVVGLGQAGVLAGMSTQAGANKAYQNLEEGYDIDTAILNGVLTGGMTALTEKIGLDNLFGIAKSGLGRLSLGAIVKQAMSEGSEEALEWAIEPLIDKVTLGKPYEYDGGELFTSVLLGMASGGVMGLGANAIPIVKTRKSFNKLNNEVNLLKQALPLTQNPQEQQLLKSYIDVGDKALNEFKKTSVFGDAVRMMKDEVEPIDLISVENALDEALRPQKDLEFRQQQAMQDVIVNAQNVLNAKGINMDAVQYYNLDEKGRAEVDKLQDYANELGVKVSFDSNYGDDGSFNTKTGEVVLNPNGKRSMVSTFVHELTHGSESSKYYSQLQAFTKDYYDNSYKGGYEGYVDYLANGSYKFLNNRADVEKEAVAIAMQNNLESYDFVERLVKYNNSLAHRIYEEIKHIATKDDYAKQVEYNFLKAFQNNERKVMEEERLRRINEQQLQPTLQMSKGEERVKDLVAIHNTNDFGAIKMLKSGGIPMPSIALTKDSIPHISFGDVTFVFDKNSVDPKNKDNVIYGRDAWTPRFPNISYETNEKNIEKINKKGKELTEKYGWNKASRLLSKLSNVNADLFSMGGEERYLEYLYNDDGLKSAFLMDKGIDEPQEVYKKEDDSLSPLHEGMGQSVLDKIGEDAVRKIANANVHDTETIKPYLPQINEALTKYYESQGKDFNKVSMKAFTMRKAVNFAQRILNNEVHKTKEVYDSEATSKLKKERLSKVNQKEYEEWVNDLFKGIEKDKKIEHYDQNKGYTYLPYSLENVVEEMKSQPEVAPNGGGWYDALFASATNKYNSLDSTIKDENRLKPLNEENSKLHKELDRKFDKLADKIKETTEYDMLKEFSAIVDAGIEANRLRPTITNVKKAFKESGYNITNDMAKEFISIMKESQKLPVEYFEAKPRRVVNTNEIKQAYVPKGTSQELLDLLKENNIQTIEYDGIEDKQNKINENASELKFSKGESADSEGNVLNKEQTEHYKDSKARDELGRLLVLYHGSTANEPFYVFDRDKAMASGDWGKGFYSTTKYDDVNNNYNGGGADYDIKFESLVERFENQDYTEEEAKKKASEILGTGEYLIEVYANVKNPAIVGETIVLNQDNYADNYDMSDFENEEDYFAEIEQLVSDDISDAMYHVQSNIELLNDSDYNEIESVLWDAYYDGGITPEVLKEKINGLYLEGIVDEEDNSDIVSNEVARLVLEGLGYDGIIDGSVSQKFNMNLEDDTKHVIVFNPNQFKLTNNLKPTSNDDIRYSKGESSNGTKLTPEQQEYFENSKVRDEQGKLMVMYRGGNQEINVFDRKKSSYSNGNGRGFYFTKDKNMASQYGDVREYYLNIKNPLSIDEHTINRKQVLSLLKAINKEDGLDNYGEGSTPSSVLKIVYNNERTDFDILKDIDSALIGDMVYTTELFNKINGTDFDGFITPHETVVFNSNQVKSVDNLNPTSNDDIRYSKGESIFDDDEFDWEIDSLLDDIDDEDLKGTIDFDMEDFDTEEDYWIKKNIYQNNPNRLTKEEVEELREHFPKFEHESLDDDEYEWNVNSHDPDEMRQLLADFKEYDKKNNAPKETNFISTKDVDNKGRTLSKGIIKYNEYSQARNDKGELLTLYHGTGIPNINEFRMGEHGLFLTDRLGTSASYANTDRIYNTPTKDDVNAKPNEGSGNYEVYANVTNPLIVNANGVGYSSLNAPLEWRKDANVKIFKNADEDTTRLNYGKYVVDWKDNFTGKEGHFFISEEDLKDIIPNEKLVNKVKAIDVHDSINLPRGEYRLSENYRWKSNYIADYAKERGYDGVIFKHMEDGEYYKKNDWEDSLYANIVVVFDPNQVKATSNLNPTYNNDIRYSLGEDDFIPIGEQPRARDSQVPSKDKDGNKVSYGARTAYESNLLDDNEAEQIIHESEEGLHRVYSPDTLMGRIEKADKEIESLGLDKAFDRYMARVDSNVDNVAFGQALARQMKLAKDSRFMQVIGQNIANTSGSGSSLSQARALKRLTPEGNLQYQEGVRQKLQNELDKKHGKKAPKIEIKQEFVDRMMEANDPDEVYEIGREIQKDLYEQVPPTIIDKLNSWRYLSMLGNPRTHVRNILGNTAFQPLRLFKDKLGAVIEQTLPQEKRTKSLIADRELMERAKEIINSKEYQSSKGDKYADLLNDRKVWKDKGFGKWLNKLSKLNSDALEIEDKFFSNRVFINAYSGFLKARGVTKSMLNNPEIQKIEADAIAYAQLESLKATYRDDSKLADALNKFAKTNKVTQFAVDTLMPFKKTPINVLKRGVEYSPLGLLDTISRQSIKLKNGDITSSEWIDSLSSGLTGTGVAVLGALLYSMGLFRTKDDDKDKKNAYDRDLGEQDYSIKVGNGSYTIDWLSPSIMPMAIGAEVYKQLEGKTNVDTILTVITGICDPIFETSMLSGITKSLSSYEQSASGKIGNIVVESMTNYMSQYLPTLGGQIARTIDDTRRTTYPNKGIVDKSIKKTLNKIPYLSTKNEEYINRKGETEKQPGKNVLSRALLNFFSPGYYKENGHDEYDDEILRLYGDNPDNMGVLPNTDTKSVKIGDEDYKLYNKEYTEYNRYKWSTEREMVNAIIDSQEYQSMDDTQRIELISKARQMASKLAKDKFLTESGHPSDDSSVNKYKEALDMGVDTSTYLLANAQYNSLHGDNKRYEYSDYLDTLNISNEAKNYLWHLNYKSERTGNSYSGGSKGSRVSSGSRGRKPKYTQKDYETTKRKLDSIIFRISRESKSPAQTYKNISKILNSDYDTLSKTYERYKPLKSNALVKEYLKEHPEDSWMF